MGGGGGKLVVSSLIERLFLFCSFLWKLDPRGAGSGLVRTFPATGANNFFIISEPSFLAVGCRCVHYQLFWFPSFSDFCFL